MSKEFEYGAGSPRVAIRLIYVEMVLVDASSVGPCVNAVEPQSHLAVVGCLECTTCGHDSLFMVPCRRRLRVITMPWYIGRKQRREGSTPNTRSRIYPTSGLYSVRRISKQSRLSRSALYLRRIGRRSKDDWVVIGCCAAALQGQGRLPTPIRVHTSASTTGPWLYCRQHRLVPRGAVCAVTGCGLHSALACIGTSNDRWGGRLDLSLQVWKVVQ